MPCSYWGSATLTDWRTLTQLLVIEETGTKTTYRLEPTPAGTGSSLVFDPRYGVYALAPGVVSEIAQKLAGDDDPRSQLLRAELLMHLVHMDSYFGEIESARAKIGEARAALEKEKAAYTDKSLYAAAAGGEEEPWRWNYGYDYTSDPKKYASWRARQVVAQVDDLAYGLEARAGNQAEPPPKNRYGAYELSHVIGAKTSTAPLDLEWLAKRDNRDVNRKLWDFALDQDGPGLVGRLEDRGLDGRGVIDFLGQRKELAPSLARWVRYGYPAACTTCGVYPLANQILSRRDAALVAGASDVVDETTAAAGRLRTLLLRRDIAIPLAAISDLSPP